MTTPEKSSPDAPGKGSPGKGESPPAGSVSDDSKKIWVTLPIKYFEIMEVLTEETGEKARSNRKSVLIEKMLDDYLEKHQKELQDDGRWAKIINVRRRYSAAPLGQKSVDEKIAFLDQWALRHDDFADIWLGIKEIGDPEEISKVYDAILRKNREKAAALFL